MAWFICLVHHTESIINFDDDSIIIIALYDNYCLQFLPKEATLWRKNIEVTSYTFAIQFNAFSCICLIQSTLVISKLKGASKILRDIRTSTYQTFRIEENTNRTTKFYK